jgi:lipid II:glycine glycyltransferase (peptidoglycan interpeptide bridge formation enzyme)
MGENLKVRIVSKDNKHIASILTIQFRRTLVYKYGSSDKLFSNLGGMQLLFWKAIQEATGEGLLEFDLGRSESDNEGLIQFKDRLGATRTTVTYWRHSSLRAAQNRETWKLGMAKRVFSHLPSTWMAGTGSLLYRHIG